MTEESNNLSDNARERLALAERKFGELTDVDKILFESVAKGKFADFTTGDEKTDNPANADKWDKDRIIPASRIIWLCTDRKAKELVTYKGIQVRGAKIEGNLDLKFARVPFSLNFEKSAFFNKIILEDAGVCGLFMEATHTKSISAGGIKVDGSIFLRDDFMATGEVRLLGAAIDGVLSCINGEFKNPAPYL